MRWIAALIAFATPVLGQDAPGPFASFDLASDSILADPHDLAIGPDGRLYVADKFNSRIAVFDPETLELVEEMNPGLLPQVRDISFGPNGEVAVAVSGAGAVAVFPNLESLPYPASLGLRAPGTEGALYHSNGRIYAMASALGILAMFENMEFLGAIEGHPGAHDVAEALDGSIWVADNAARRLVRYSAELERLQVLNDPEVRLPRAAISGYHPLRASGGGRPGRASCPAHRSRRWRRRDTSRRARRRNARLGAQQIR